MLFCFSFLFTFSLVFLYPFNVDAERMIMYDTTPVPYERIDDIYRLRSTRLILVGCGQLNYSTVLHFLHQVYMTLAI